MEIFTLISFALLKLNDGEGNQENIGNANTEHGEYVDLTHPFSENIQICRWRELIESGDN